MAKLIPEFSRGRIQRWLKQKQVLINGILGDAKQKCKGGEQVTIDADMLPETSLEAQPIVLNVIYEDEDVLIINKPAGLVVHPAAGHPSETLLNALLHHAPECRDIPRAGIIHRLDKDTTGLLVIAKTLSAHHILVQAMQARTIKREYQAIAQGHLISGRTINAPIGRHARQRTKMAIQPHGKEAITHFRVIEKFSQYTFVHVQLETGRTHQIRVHFSYINHPLVGDPVYGGRLLLPKGGSEELYAILRNFKRQALHAWQLSFQHPRTQKFLQFQTTLPQDMQQLLAYLKINFNTQKEN